MFIATALTLRGENNILSSSPQEAAHLLQNCQRAFAGGTGTMESRGNTRHQDLARRPALMISRIVSRSLFDVPVNKGRASFFGADRKRMLNRPRGPFA